MLDLSDLPSQPDKRKELLRFIISRCLNLSVDLDKFLLLSIDDGGMGSFSYQKKEVENINREKKYIFSEASYVDEDGVDVLIEFYNIEEVYFEAAFWKVDFSRLILFPNSNLLRNIECVS